MKRKYYINGWEYGKQYFMSFGFTEGQIERMMDGEIIKRGDNEFWIVTEE